MAKQIIDITKCELCRHNKIVKQPHGFTGQLVNITTECELNKQLIPNTVMDFVHNPCPAELEYLDQRKKDFEAGRKMGLHNTFEYDSFTDYINSEK